MARTRLILGPVRMHTVKHADNAGISIGMRNRGVPGDMVRNKRGGSG